ncbi:DsbA family protein [Serratia bockelmannii]|uniref:DsbA family protein n=1 Tax=Serratia bockelmannii TaxID=2703793 RepID=A0ABT8LW93_9GAMM|nr:DsbA family protein [Serratia bockelmannii]MDN6881582.1 DsbA family protein [Serratia bockelmannii]HBH6890268.1 DsbA family protein [Serratia marcescens]
MRITPPIILGIMLCSFAIAVWCLVITYQEKAGESVADKLGPPTDFQYGGQTPVIKSAPPVAFTQTQQEAIGAIARDYLLAHPEILLQMSDKLEAQQQSAANRTVQTALITQPELQATLLHNPATPVVHPDGTVTVVQFFDYQCIWCARMAPVVADFVRDNPDVRFVFKEFPIFGSRWPMSVQAARTGLTLWQLKGGDAYLAYHNAVFASGENEGRLSQPTLNAALLAAGATPMTVLPETEKSLLATRELAQQLNISGTPAFIVMPTRDARADQVTPLYGAVDVKALQAAVAQAKAGGN